MDADRLIASLEQFRYVLPAAVGGLDAEAARWRGPGGAWSILEIMTHLADEEVEDFRTRVDLTLNDPDAKWPPIDPEGAAVERRYNEGDLAVVTERFVTERTASVAWLRSLHDPDWGRTHTHPALGAIRAGDILASWAAHDALHIRQIAKRRFQMIGRDAGEYGTEYAGAW